MAGQLIKVIWKSVSKLSIRTPTLKGNETISFIVNKEGA